MSAARVPTLPEIRIPSPHNYPHVLVRLRLHVIRLAPEIDRDAVMAALEERGIPSRPYFTPIHLQPFYQERFGYREGDFPVTEVVARSVLALPFFGTMTEEQVEHVCESLVEVLHQ